MSAVVTLKLTPAEFDLIREALDAYRTDQARLGKHAPVGPQKSNALKQSTLTARLIEKLA